MDIALMLLLYVVAIPIVGFLILGDEIVPKFLIEDKTRRLGPSYWGVYKGASPTDSDEEQTIPPPEPCAEIETAAGSGSYSGGKAISSAKS